MKRHRRVEITAFHRKVTIVSGESEAQKGDDDVAHPIAENSLETVSPDSADGRRILADAVQLLKDRLLTDRSDHPR